MALTCRACHGEEFALVLDLGPMPLAGGFLDSLAAAADEHRYPLAVHVCTGCALVQILEPVDPAVLFQDYSFSTGTVPGLVRHFDSYAAWLVDRFRPGRVVEFGCNDGTLLAALSRRGVAAVGVDLSKNITDMARQQGHTVVTAAFTPEVAASIRAEHGPADVVTGSNVFAHNEDPTVILEAARAVLRPEGSLCLEVMYAGDLFEQTQWDTLYHEHLTFYALRPLMLLLERNGFTVTHAERIPLHGGSLRIAASMAPTGVAPSVGRLLGEEEAMGIHVADGWATFAASSRRSIDVVASVMGALSRSAEIWGYGAAGKATMWVNACEMHWLQAVVDASPLRAGRFMPGTHTPIVSPEEFRRDCRAGFVLVTAWNYLDTIRRNEAWYRGTWVTPLPTLSFS